MVEANPNTKWYFRGLFVVITTLIVFAHLIPLQTVPSRWAAPDLLICFSFAWVLRRSEYMPILMIAAVMLLTDVLYMRPLGLMPALVVLGVEFLRARTQLLRELPFALEWGMVGIVLLGITLSYQLALTLVLAPRSPPSLTTLQYIATLLAYPLVVLFSQYVLGVRKTSPGQVDALGHRL